MPEFSKHNQFNQIVNFGKIKSDGAQGSESFQNSLRCSSAECSKAQPNNNAKE